MAGLSGWTPPHMAQCHGSAWSGADRAPLRGPAEPKASAAFSVLLAPAPASIVQDRQRIGLCNAPGPDLGQFAVEPVGRVAF